MTVTVVSLLSVPHVSGFCADGKHQPVCLDRLCACDCHMKHLGVGVIGDDTLNCYCFKCVDKMLGDREKKAKK